jgi:Calcineurin-like phosphoesterase/Secretion system C-terminal sorting domain
MKYRSIIFFVIVLIFVSSVTVKSQTYSELLGRPTDTSITMNFLVDTSINVYWEIGTTSGNYTKTTSTYTTIKDTPIVVAFSNLLANTKYYYRSRYRINGSTGSYASGTEHFFHTQRPRGTSFSFAVEADPHLDTNCNPASYTLTLQNMLVKQPDFLIDLGDIFMSEKLDTINQANITKRTTMFRPYFKQVCHSVPLYLTIGNHEGELGWLNNNTDTCLPVRAANTRKKYYNNPYPNSFYTGNTIAEPYVGLRENYYAWEWGNALFVVIDPYWYTKVTNKAGWGWTLGSAQYNWFKSTIVNSTAKFKFVFCHQLVGGNGNDGRGGTEWVDFYEMGGKNTDSTYGFNTYRPGWGDPIHGILKNNNGSIYFHGHDHFYGKQDKDCIVYQEVPQPSAKNIKNNLAAQWGYYTGVFFPSRGYLLVTVDNDSAKVDYIKTYIGNEVNATQVNGSVGYSYKIGNCKSNLPISLTSFSGYKELSNSLLKWTSSTEINTSYFDIERSVDGVEFAKIGEVKAMGNSASSINYSFIDKSPVYGINYYRLKEWDADGKFNISNIISIDHQQKNTEVVVYPNPSSDKVQIIFNDNSNNHISKLVTITGQVLAETTMNFISLKNIPNGVYIIQLETGKEIVNKKIVVQH